MTGWAIRDAVAADAADLARVQVETWRAAYTGLIADDVLAGLSLPQVRARWESWLPVRPPSFCLVTGSPPVGFVSAGRPEDGGEVYAIYVSPPAWRRGAGRVLLDAALARLRDAGAVTAGLWVLRGNAAAQSFYEALGWTLTGEERLEELLGAQLPVLRYEKRLEPTG